jgi:formylglycine-generating enzyme required for sulfatase activity
VKKSYFIILLLLLSPIFFIKSSNISLSENYIDFIVKSSNSIVIKNTAYSFSNKFTLNVSSSGYKESTFNFDHRDSEKIVVLDELPISVSIEVEPQTDPVVLIDGKIISDFNMVDLYKGTYELFITHRNFITHKSLIKIDSYQKNLVIPVILDPVDVTVDISSFPIGASATLNNKFIGVTPVSININSNKNNLILTKEGFETTKVDLSISTNDPESFFFNMDKAKDVLSINTSPSAATIFLDNEYQGISPLQLSDYKNQIIKIQKYGYEDLNYNIKSNDKALNFDLKKATVLISINTLPSSDIYIDGKFIGKAPGDFQLQKIKQKISFKRVNYRTVNKVIEPIDNNFNIEEILLTETQAVIAESKNLSKNSIGIDMLLIEPGSILMGSPKNQSRRDINEIQKNVKFTRHFYMSKNLINEEQFKKFMQSYSNSSNLPVNNISWTEAAQFCNWLSKKEGFDNFYIFTNNKLSSYNASSNGYRLPTEAEWEYVSKSNLPNNFIFSWGVDRQITKPIANLADESTKQVLANFIDDYSDGFAERSPIGSFKSNQNGFNDLTGNLSEWVNDFYSVEILAPNKILYDYYGPLYGSKHVIKGSNFYSSNPLQLGISYRTYGSDGDKLVGFRVARWIY